MQQDQPNQPKIKTLLLDTGSKCTNSAHCTGCHQHDNIYMGSDQNPIFKNWVSSWTPEMLSIALETFPDTNKILFGNVVSDPLIQPNFISYLKMVPRHKKIICTNASSGGELVWAQMTKQLNASDQINISIYNPDKIVQTENGEKIIKNGCISDLLDRIHTVINTDPVRPRIEVHLVDYKETRESNNRIIQDIYDYLQSQDIEITVNQASKEDYILSENPNAHTNTNTPIWNLNDFKDFQTGIGDKEVRCPMKETVQIDHFGNVSRCVPTNREYKLLNKSLPNIFINGSTVMEDLLKFDDVVEFGRTTRHICNSICPLSNVSQDHVDPMDPVIERNREIEYINGIVTE